MGYQIARGTFDILPEDPDPSGSWRCSHLWNYLENEIRTLCHEFGYREIRTPLFERTELFSRSIGKGTDIVTKEMYTFKDRSDRSMTLRPEGTAPVMRAFIEKNLAQQSSHHKFFYLLPMFRYERSQAGRYRQHHQFGVEAIGSPSPMQDVEVIDLLHTLFQRLGLKGCSLQLNSIGTPKTRAAYKKALTGYLHDYLSSLSSESQTRFHTNPLRILDSKNPADQKVLQKAPSILEFLDAPSKAHFDEVCSLLEDVGLTYTLNPLLVRGLDYYNHTVFEITAEELGAQNSLGGGGRYDGLLKELGGPDLPAIGFGAGIERILQTLLAQKAPLPTSPRSLLFLIPLGEEASRFCFQLLTMLRHSQIQTEMDFSGKKLKGAMRYASGQGVRFVAVVGEEEIKSKTLSIKDMEKGTEEKIPVDHLLKRFKNA